jgi:hypothetical protein
MLANRIHVYQDDRVSVLAEGDHLEHPNGLLVHGGRLIVAGWGAEIAADFSTKRLGRLFSLDLQDGTKARITPEPLGNLDGVEAIEQTGFVVSDWIAGKVYFVQPDGAARLLVQLPKGAADLGYQSTRRLLIVPQMLENKLTAFELVRPAAGVDIGR